MLWDVYPRVVDTESRIYGISEAARELEISAEWLRQGERRRTFTISQAVDELSVTPSSLRFCERLGPVLKAKGPVTGGGMIRPAPTRKNVSILSVESVERISQMAYLRRGCDKGPEPRRTPARLVL